MCGRSFGNTMRKMHYDSLNTKARNVAAPFGSFIPSVYWNNALNNNFIITGGEDIDRESLLCSAISNIQMKDSDPIIILSINSSLEDSLIYMAQNNMIGNLFCFSNRYRNYDPLVNMDDDTIKQFFTRFFTDRGGTEVDLFEDYINSILTILRTKYVPSLDSINALMQIGDSRINEFGREMGVSDSILSIIRANVHSGQTFRNILKTVREAFNNISVPDKETGLNILGVQNGQIYYIETLSQNRDCIHLELEMEINHLLASGRRFHLLINDLSFANNDVLFDKMNDVKTNPNSNIGICCQDIISLNRGMDNDNSLLSDVPAKLILKMTDMYDFTKVLKLFGTYQHYEYDEISGALHIVNRDRLMLNEVEKYYIIVSGHNGSAIELYQRIRY